MPATSAPWEGTGKARRHMLGAGTRVVAINRLGRSTLVVSLEKDSLRLCYIGHERQPPAGSYLYRQDRFVWPEDDHGLLRHCLWPPLGGEASVLALDASGNLFRLRAIGRELLALVEESAVLALTTAGGIPGYLRVDRSNGVLEYVRLWRAKRRVVAWQCGRAERAFFGYSPHLQAPFSVLAVEREPCRWLVVGDGSYEIESPEAEEVVGVAQEKDHAEALVTLSEDRREIRLRGRDWLRTVAESPDPMIHVAVSQNRPLVAYVTAKEVITVHSLAHRSTVCRFQNLEGT